MLGLRLFVLQLLVLVSVVSNSFFSKRSNWRFHGIRTKQNFERVSVKVISIITLFFILTFCFYLVIIFVYFYIFK